MKICLTCYHESCVYKTQRKLETCYNALLNIRNKKFYDLHQPQLPKATTTPCWLFRIFVFELQLALQDCKIIIFKIVLMLTVYEDNSP